MLNQEQQSHFQASTNDVKESSETVVLTSMKVLKKLFELVKQRGKENKVNIDLKNAKNVQIVVDGEPKYQEKDGKISDSLENKDLIYLDKVLDLPEGKAPDGFNRNVSIKIDDKEVYRLRNGVVELNLLQNSKEQRPDILIDEQEDKSQKEVSSYSNKPAIKGNENQKLTREPITSQDVKNDLKKVAVLGVVSKILNSHGVDRPGGKIYDGNKYSFEQEGNNLKVSTKERGAILEFNDGKLTGNLEEEDYQQFEQIDKHLNQQTISQSSLETSENESTIGVER